MSMDLVFRRPLYSGGPIDLVFGATDDAESPPAWVTSTTVLGGPDGVGVAAYDNRNPRRVSTTASAPWQRAANASGEPDASWGNARLAAGEAAPRWQPARPASGEPATAWGRTTPKSTDPAARWQPAQQVAAQNTVRHQSGAQIGSQASARWQHAASVAVAPMLRHQRGIPNALEALITASQARPITVIVLAPHQRAKYVAGDRWARWQQARAVAPGKEPWPPVSPEHPQPHVPDLNLLFACPAYEPGAPIDLVFGRVCTSPPGPAVVVIPVRSVYVAQNNVSLHRVPSGDEFVASRFNLQIDADSFTFSWSASLHISARAHLGRSDPGERIDVECAVNGILVRLVIEKIGRDRSFPEDRISVSGRGRVAELADTDLTFANPADRTAQQLMADVLTVNGVSMGWALDWQITDWFVPANRWVFRGSYIGALQDIASAAGAYIQPHLTAKTLRVLPRYPHAPWDWATLLPVDIELPVEATTEVGFEEVIRPDHNRVFVGGVQAPGIFGPVTRAGTAGDKVALPIVHPLITAAEAHIQRGRAELSNFGVKEMVSVRTLVMPETGIILPGKALRFVDEDGPRLGLVRGTNVSMEAWPVMHQTLEVETHAQ